MRRRSELLELKVVLYVLCACVFYHSVVYVAIFP
jgi:hypothetical protein